MVVLGGGALSYERGTPEHGRHAHIQPEASCMVVLWCFVLDPHQHHAHLKTKGDGNDVRMSCVHARHACLFLQGKKAGVESGPFLNLRFNTH